MNRPDSHPSDRELVQAVDGELTPREMSRVHQHLEACWSCRTRKLEFESAITDFVRAYRDGPSLPPPEGPRALLKAQMEQLTAACSTPRVRWYSFLGWRAAWPIAAALAAAVGFGTLWEGRDRTSRNTVAVAFPNPELTPGAAILSDSQEVCRGENTKNKEVPVSLQRRVFEAYGIPRARPDAYEVDYLITPALGGADDIHNLWPHSYANTVWNAEVKDALEDRLREMVCAGEIDLHTAQREIAVNWIDAYKKYFHTDRPLE